MPDSNPLAIPPMSAFDPKRTSQPHSISRYGQGGRDAHVQEIAAFIRTTELVYRRGDNTVRIDLVRQLDPGVKFRQFEYHYY